MSKPDKLKHCLLCGQEVGTDGKFYKTRRQRSYSGGPSKSEYYHLRCLTEYSTQQKQES